IERRPGMHLGSDDDLQGLEHYMLGYDAACQVNGLPQLLVGLQFAEWVTANKRPRLGGPANGAFGLIRLNFPSSELAWKTFFEWFREYHRLTTGHYFESLDDGEQFSR
ncbi:MAG: hypothetical protein NTY98_00100, partial [Verrucomicrobia bacterium]|nr:hypothetical protein [Verrucomicrobiota bacterium]